MKTGLKLALVLLALVVSMNYAFAWSLCVGDPCGDRDATDGYVYLMPPDDPRTMHIRYQTCPACQVLVTCEVNGTPAWTRTYSGTGTDIIHNTVPGLTIRLKVLCQQDPTSPLMCPPDCRAWVGIGNPATFVCP